MVERIAISRLRLLVSYDPGTGRLYWLPRTPEMFRHGNTGREANCSAWNKRYAAKPAFANRTQNGYLHGAIGKTNYRAHQIAWAIHYGEWPTLVDHKDGNGRNNRISNLRIATFADNARNRRHVKGGTSNFHGVSWHKGEGKWRATIKENRVAKHLGYFRSEIAAARAYDRAARKIFGEFARPNFPGAA